jgi:hypothetical protein
MTRFEEFFLASEGDSEAKEILEERVENGLSIRTDRTEAREVIERTHQQRCE